MKSTLDMVEKYKPGKHLWREGLLYELWILQLYRLLGGNAKKLARENMFKDFKVIFIYKDPNYQKPHRKGQR